MKRKVLKLKLFCNYPPPFFIALLISLLCAGSAYSQTNCDCDMIENGELTWTTQPPGSNIPFWQLKLIQNSDERIPWWNPLLPYSIMPPYPNTVTRPANGWYPPWNRSHGTPNSTFNNTSQPSSLHFVIKATASFYKSEGIVEKLCKNVIAGKPYILIYHVNKNGMCTDSIGPHAFLTDAIPPFQQLSFQLPIVTNKQHIISSYTTPGFKEISSCFVANNNWSHLWIYADAPLANVNCGFDIDDISLHPNFDFAGNDTAICDEPAYVSIGDTSCHASFYGKTVDYTWYMLPDTLTAISANPILSVNPATTTDYLVKREISGISCPGYDTVTVRVGTSHFFDLGADMAFCRPDSFILDAGYHPSCVYIWNGRTTNSQYFTAYESGVYCATVITLPDSCITSDCINITVHPEIHVEPDTVITCDTNRCYTFDAGAGFSSYTWFKNDTNTTPIANTRKICVNDPGTYIVHIYDVNGCHALDTARLLYGKGLNFSLGLDQYICDYGIPIELKVPIDTNLIDSVYWSTGDTTYSIFVSQSSTIVLYIQDTFQCFAMDSIDIVFLELDSIQTSDTTLCQLDSFIKLDLANPTGGYYQGEDGFIFETRDYEYYFYANISGVHKVGYAYPDTHNINNNIVVCWNFDSLEITIHPKPEMDIIVPSTFCITDNDYIMTIDPDSFYPGIWGGLYANGSSHTTDSLFSPANADTGMHYISYLFTDSLGCKDTAETYIEVFDTFEINIVEVYSGCGYKILKVLADESKWGSLTYVWNDNATLTQQTLRVSNTGYYTVKVTSLLNVCDAVDTYYVSFSCSGLLANVTSNAYRGQPPGMYIRQNATWNNQTKVSDIDIIVTTGYTLSILSSTVYMRNCSRIIVQNGAHLLVDSSCIGLCEWEGIEVWGIMDACSDRIGVGQAHGLVSINNSFINNADIAILSGKRDTSFVWGYDPWYNGGVIQVDNDTFENNYIDIMFEDWNVGGICECTDSFANPWANGLMFHHYIVNNYFGKMTDEGHCTNWQYANERIDSVQYFNSQPPLIDYIYNKCHIVDMTPYFGVSASNPVGGYSWNFCPRAIQITNVGGNATQNNSYYEDNPNHDPGCTNTPPNDNYH